MKPVKGMPRGFGFWMVVLLAALALVSASPIETTAGVSIGSDDDERGSGGEVDAPDADEEPTPPPVPTPA
jgi:hypothetical protein